MVGSWGESVAAAYLLRKKYRLVSMNYRSRYGEIDLIVSNRKYLVFVEVKLRKTDKFASAYEHVDFASSRKLERQQKYFFLNTTQIFSLVLMLLRSMHLMVQKQ